MLRTRLSWNNPINWGCPSRRIYIGINVDWLCSPSAYVVNVTTALSKQYNGPMELWTECMESAWVHEKQFPIVAQIHGKPSQHPYTLMNVRLHVAPISSPTGMSKGTGYWEQQQYRFRKNAAKPGPSTIYEMHNRWTGKQLSHHWCWGQTDHPRLHTRQVIYRNRQNNRPANISFNLEVEEPNLPLNLLQLPLVKVWPM